MSTDLFSPDLSTRLVATNHAIEVGRTTQLNWPAGCRGAPNAYVVFIGPSPGAPDKGTQHQPGGTHRPINSSTAKFGDGFGVEEFRDKTQRNWKWRRLFSCIVGDQDEYRKLTGVWNLDWGTFPNQNDVLRDHLEGGTDTVFSLISVVKPRVLILLTKGVTEIFTDYLQSTEIAHTPWPGPAGFSEPVFVVNFPRVDFPTLVLKTPRHPSRIPLSSDQQKMIREIHFQFSRS